MILIQMNWLIILLHWNTFENYVVLHGSKPRENSKSTKKIKRESKNRFRQPPVAKCYCLYCKYAEYFGDDRCGKCSLWGNDIVIKDNGFCYRADPKK